jgi:gamma-glutamyltranspeptidase / glutathione hydrolase
MIFIMASWLPILLQASASSGGYFHAADLGDFRPEWVDPISVRYHGYDVWELPPNGQGLAALQAWQSWTVWPAG